MTDCKSLVLLLLTLNHAAAQSQATFDSTSGYALALYKKTVGLNTHLYKGKEYIDYNHQITGNPYFASVYFTEGSVNYEGVFYEHVQMFYDILHDEVVIKSYNNIPLQLVKEKISSFNLTGHHFINLGADSSLTNFKISGFYDVMYDKNTKLFVKRKKEIIEKISIQNYESHFAEKNERYILKDNVLYAVNTKNSVLSVIKDKRKEIIKYMHQSKIKFRKTPEAAMIKMVSYYDDVKKVK